MALSKGANAYATVDEANTYFVDRLDALAWTAADSTSKAQALVTASSMLDNLQWVGTAISEDQPLAWPRNGEYFDPKAGTSISLENTVVPTRIIKATYELAYHLLNNDGLLDDTGISPNFSIGQLSFQGTREANKIPGTVINLINPLRLNSGANPWWRAN